MTFLQQQQGKVHEKVRTRAAAVGRSVAATTWTIVNTPIATRDKQQKTMQRTGWTPGESDPGDPRPRQKDRQTASPEKTQPPIPRKFCQVRSLGPGPRSFWVNNLLCPSWGRRPCEGNHSLKHGPLRSRCRGKQGWSVQIARESLPRNTSYSAASRHVCVMLESHFQDKQTHVEQARSGVTPQVNRNCCPQVSRGRRDLSKVRLECCFRDEERKSRCGTCAA